jgi:hypothetical protein
VFHARRGGNLRPLGRRGCQERASYLRAYRIADPALAESLLVEGLWDCEEGVRRVAAEHVALDAETRQRLSYLRDDPMECAGVRGAAAARLES